MEYITLNNGVKMPKAGFGVYQVNKEECERVVMDAIKAGYRLIDTAQSYFNEEEVGNAIQKAINDGLVKREELFITSKVSNKTNTKTDSTKRINAGNYYLEYGKYENITYDIEQGGGTYILNEDGTFTSTNFQGTATGKYTVSLETYTNSDHTETNWLIKFKSSDNNVYANYDWIIDGNNEFHGIQDGGTNKYIGK